MSGKSATAQVGSDGGLGSASSSKSPTRKKVMKDPLEDLSPEEYRKSYPLGFASSEQLGNTWVFKFFYFFFWTLSEWIYGVEIKGTENIEGINQWFSIGMHSTHNADILVGMFTNWKMRKIVGRGFMHRIIFRFCPWVINIGLLPGSRSAASVIIKSGFVCGALPGGGEEAMYGHEHAYDLHPKWHERRGFVKVAREGRVPILPLFVRNVEEMRFNPFFFVFNFLGLSKLYSEKLMTLPGLPGWIFKQIGMFVWFNLAWVGIPVPVKITYYIGKPIFPDYDKESDDEIAEKAREAMQNLINEHQPHKHSYLPGLIERWEYLVKEQLPKPIGLWLISLQKSLFGSVKGDKLKTS